MDSSRVPIGSGQLTADPRRIHCHESDIVQYVNFFSTLLVTTSQAKLALIAAFVFMGLWHNFSLGFLVWGLGHGVGLAFLLPFAQRCNINPTTLRVASFAYVILLSSVAHGVWSQ